MKLWTLIYIVYASFVTWSTTTFDYSAIDAMSRNVGGWSSGSHYSGGSWGGGGGHK